jgi:ABC-type transport system involved in multi-copper enzyme maturation permease subunit
LIVGSVYTLTLRQLSGRWRLLIMATLAALPVVQSIFALRQADAPTIASFEAVVLSAMLAGSILPLVVLAIAAAAFANEIEDRTIANLTLAPIPRWQIALPKLLAIITIASPFIAVSAFLTSHIAFLGDARATMAVVGASLVGVAMYASLFVWLGLVTTQAIGVGLLYVVLWEGLFARFVAGVRLLSIRYFSIDLMHGLDDRRFSSGNHLGLTAVLVIAALIIGGFLFLSIRRLRRMDIP